MLYRRVLRPLLFALPAEAAHAVAFGGLRALMATPGLGPLTEACLSPRGPRGGVTAMGLRFPHPIGLAAGFDKDAVGVRALTRLGFGHVEVGTLTAHAQAGNPRPRMFRLPEDRALVNRMGFNNRGSLDAVPRLVAYRESGCAVPLGVNLGKSKVTDASRASEDYRVSAARVAEFADYLVVNVSSPNTPGLRSLQAAASLGPIVDAVRAASLEACREVGRAPPPLAIKIAPDLHDHDVDAVAELALDLGVEGLIATNTTISRDGLTASPERVASVGGGGLSGAPLEARALAVLERLRRRTDGRVSLIASGGVMGPEQAWSRMRAGASLVQVYTGFIYGGPLTVRRMVEGLLRRAGAAGFDELSAVVAAATSGR